MAEEQAACELELRRTGKLRLQIAAAQQKDWVGRMRKFLAVLAEWIAAVILASLLFVFALVAADQVKKAASDPAAAPSQDAAADPR